MTPEAGPEPARSEPGGCFARVARLAARLFDVSVVLLGFAEGGKIRFGRALGMAAGSALPGNDGASPWSQLFWRGGPVVVPDLAVNPGIAALPGPLAFARFFASHPLPAGTGARESPGFLVLLDARPRSLSGADLALLADLAALAAGEAAEGQGREERLDAVMGEAAQFLSNVTHEIRTPLSGIVGGYDLLRETRLAPEQQRYAELIGSGVGALLEIIDTLVDFSNFACDTPSLKKAEFNLRETLEKAIASLRAAAFSKGISVALDLPASLPGRLRGDGARLREVVTALLTNAIKFSESGPIRLSVVQEPETGSGGASARFRFTLSDQGIGIEKEKQRQIFMPFVQADGRPTRRYGGSGLGLALSQKIVDAMGGRIGVESEPGKGSCFWFTLPFEIVAGDAGKEAAASPGAPPLRVLVAEDNRVNQMIILEQLARLGCRARAVSNGEAVLSLLETERFDVVLMDCQMPGLDGYGASAEIRRREAATALPPLRIIALTANTLPGEQERCLAAGMDQYLAKPLRLEELRGVLFSPPPRAATASVLNPGQMEALRNESPGLLARLVVLFGEASQKAIEGMESARAAGNEKAMASAAHLLKGSALNFGASRLVAACEALEQAAREGDCARFQKLLDALRAEYQLVMEALRAT